MSLFWPQALLGFLYQSKSQSHLHGFKILHQRFSIFAVNQNHLNDLRYSDAFHSTVKITVGKKGKKVQISSYKISKS